MDLIRGWENRYAPAETGGLRLSLPVVYRNLGDEDGVGDEREGEIRVGLTGSITSTGPSLGPTDLRLQLEENVPAIEIESLLPGERQEFQQPVKLEVSGSHLEPFLLCLSREPKSKQEWEALRASLPERYDTWTITKNVQSLQFEIECGIQRWMGLNEITRHQVTRFRGWISYSYDTIPDSIELSEIDQAIPIGRWLNKGTSYQDQQEYRLGWIIQTPQMPALPNSIDIELTKTGLSMFEPWSPPSE